MQINLPRKLLLPIEWNFWTINKKNLSQKPREDRNFFFGYPAVKPEASGRYHPNCAAFSQPDLTCRSEEDSGGFLQVSEPVFLLHVTRRSFVVSLTEEKTLGILKGITVDSGDVTQYRKEQKSSEMHETRRISGSSPPPPPRLLYSHPFNSPWHWEARRE